MDSINMFIKGNESPPCLYQLIILCEERSLGIGSRHVWMIVERGISKLSQGQHSTHAVIPYKLWAAADTPSDFPKFVRPLKEALQELCLRIWITHPSGTAGNRVRRSSISMVDYCIAVHPFSTFGFRQLLSRVPGLNQILNKDAENMRVLNHYHCYCCVEFVTQPLFCCEWQSRVSWCNCAEVWSVLSPRDDRA